MSAILLVIQACDAYSRSALVVSFWKESACGGRLKNLRVAGFTRDLATLAEMLPA